MISGDRRYFQYTDENDYYPDREYIRNIIYADGIAIVSPQASASNVISGNTGIFSSFDRGHFYPSTDGGMYAAQSQHEMLIHFSRPIPADPNGSLGAILFLNSLWHKFDLRQRQGDNNSLISLLGNYELRWTYINTYVQLLISDFDYQTVTYATRPLVSSTYAIEANDPITESPFKIIRSPANSVGDNLINYCMGSCNDFRCVGDFDADTGGWPDSDFLTTTIYGLLVNHSIDVDGSGRRVDTPANFALSSYSAMMVDFKGYGGSSGLPSNMYNGIFAYVFAKT